MSENLYALLGVDARADNAALKWAYERKLAEAARTGALRRAQELDAAYEVLRSDSRRALYDRHGVSQPLPRQHPLECWAPVRPVPFRAWTPVEEGTVRRGPVPGRPQRRRRRRGRDSAGQRWAAIALFGVASLSVSAWVIREQSAEPPPATGPTARTIEVVCDATATGPAYSYLTDEGAVLDCSNGAVSRWAVREKRVP